MSRPRLLHIIGTLGGLHAANFALTLLIIPHLTRVLGVQGWGEIVFAQLVLNYLIWFCNWSFYLNTAKKISAQRDHPAVMQQLYSATLTSQWLLTIVALVLLWVRVMAVPRLHETATLYHVGSLLILGNALQPLWFLNAIESIRESSLAQIAAKLIALPGIFLLIRDSHDIHLYFVINGVAGLLTGVATLYWIKRRHGMRISLATWAAAKQELQDGFSLFAATLWANMQGSLIPLGLGIFGGSTALGLYSLADRVRSAAIQLLHPITHALFSRMCHLFSHSREEAFALLKRSGLIILPAAIAISALLCLHSSSILLLLGGPAFEASAPVLAILAFTVAVMTASEFLIYQWLIPTGQNQLTNQCKIGALALSTALLYPSIIYWGAQGAAWLSLMSELTMTVIIIIGLLQHTNSRALFTP